MRSEADASVSNHRHHACSPQLLPPFFAGHHIYDTDQRSSERSCRAPRVASEYVGTTAWLRRRRTRTLSEFLFFPLHELLKVGRAETPIEFGFRQS